MGSRAFLFLVANLSLAAVGLGPAGGQGNPPPPAGFDARPIGKVLTVSGAVTIEHTTAVVVQANISVSWPWPDQSR